MALLEGSESVQRARTQNGLQVGKHLISQERDKAYINTQLFGDYIGRVLMPHLAMSHTQAEFTEDEPVILILMDNCPEWVVDVTQAVDNGLRARRHFGPPHDKYPSSS
jgi:hypothetical protein